MPRRNITVAIVLMVLFVVNTVFSASLEEDFNDFLHYIKIGLFDLAKGHAQRILESNPDPVELFSLSQNNPESYNILLRVNEVAPDAELTTLSSEIIRLIEQGRFIRRSDSKLIVQEVKRLNTTPRGRLIAVKHLQDAGEYAIPYMLDAMADKSRQDEFANIAWALPQIGRTAIRPLVASLQMQDVVLKTEIAKALGDIRYPQSLPYLKYIIEKDPSSELRSLAHESISKIDAGALNVPAAALFFELAERYYYHSESLAPPADANFANMWFWDTAKRWPIREEVDRRYFNELMAMRCCEWALRADEGFGRAIGLWVAAFFKAEATGLTMPDYFGQGHADALVYATTAGPEYLHQALDRALRDGNADVALGAVEALAATAGESSLFYALGPVQPLLKALSFNDRAVRYSAAIAIATAGPRQGFAESRLVVANLAEALGQVALETAEDTERLSSGMANDYAIRAADAMLKLAESRNIAFDLSLAQGALVAATRARGMEIQIVSSRTLAYLPSPEAQRAIAAMAIDSANDFEARRFAFESLAISAKLNTNLLPEAMIDAIYALISSEQVERDLRIAASAAYGALNLPSRKVKDLILDQAKS
jgi:HEAT repeat protein